MKDLIQRCYDWVEKNVPKRTRLEYEVLLRCNERLAVTLISKCMAHDELLAAYHKLEKDIWDATPTPPWVGSLGVHVDAKRRERIYTIRWDINPLKQYACVDDGAVIEERYAEHSAALVALRSHFMREVAPTLFEKAVSSVRASLG